MIENQVIFKNGKWYCKKCRKVMLEHKYIQKRNTSKYKKGEIIIWWSHKNKLDARSCSRKNKKCSEETKYKMSRSKKGKLSPMKGKKQYQEWIDKRKESIKNKTPEQIAEIRRKIINTKKKNATLATSKSEQRSIIKMQKVFSNDFIPHPIKDQLLKINNKLINYPGCSPDGFLISQNAFVEFQYYWTHGGHPYNIDSIEDKSVSKFFLEKSKLGQYSYSRAYHTFTYHDPLKRKWCKENNFNLLEFFSEKDLDNYLKSYINKSAKTTNIVNKS